MRDCRLQGRVAVYHLANPVCLCWWHSRATTQTCPLRYTSMSIQVLCKSMWPLMQCPKSNSTVRCNAE